MSHRYRRHPLAIAMTLALAAPLTAFGQIQEVLVTAQKREENLQTTPIAISALSADTLTNLGVTSFEGVAKASPSISFTPYPSSSNLLILYMRGQGVSDPMQITSDGSVGLYQDGFYISRPQASTFDLADIERVEVLRGPQGTLYGRNTTGGAVNLISKKPTGEFGFKQTLSFGTLNYFRSLTTVDLPAWGGVATKFTLLKSAKDGYVKNSGSGHDFGEEEQQAGRFALHWDVAERFAVDYFFEYGELDSTPLYYQNGSLNGSTMLGFPYNHHDSPRDRTYRPVDLDLSTSDFEGHGLTLTWDAADNFQIKSLTGYRDLSWEAFQDYVESFTSDPGPLPSTGPVSTASHDVVHDHQFSQEFQFIGSAFDNRVEYVAGLYYFTESASHFERYTILVPNFGLTTLKDRWVSADSESKAVYAQATWTPPILNDRFSATLGVRYTEDEREAQRRFIIDDTFQGILIEDAATARNKDDFSKTNPALTFDYNWTDDVSTYVKWVTGYKAGGSSESGAFGSFNQTFQPEEVTTYELGLKSYWLDRRVRVNAALFQSEFEDMQLAFNSNPADTSIVQAYNAGDATVKGFELELLVVPTADLTLTFDYAYLDPEFDEVRALEGTTFDPAVNPASPYRVGDDIKEVFALPYAAQDTVNAAVDYTFLRFDKGDLTAHLDYHFQSKMFDTATTGPAVPGKEFYQVPSYGIFNARLTWSFELPRGENAKVSLWGKNIFNKEYPVQVIGLGNGIATPGVPAGYTQSAKIWAPPPAYGVEFVYEY